MKLSTSVQALTVALCLVLCACGKKTEEKTRAKDQNNAPTETLIAEAQKAFQEAVKNNDLPSLQNLLAHHKFLDLDEVFADGETPLTSAIKNDFTQIRNYLILRKANINAPNMNGMTPLIMAVIKKSENSVRALMEENGLKLDLKNNEGNTALQIAIKNKLTKIAMILVKEGCNLYLTNSEGKNAYQLVHETDSKELQDLINGMMLMDVDVTTFKRMLQDGTPETISMMLEKFPKIIREYEFINPLAMLLEMTDTNQAFFAMEILLKYRIDTKGPKDAFETPLILAVRLEKRDFINLLISHGANPNHYDRDGKSALYHAIEQNNPEIVNKLLNSEAIDKYTFRRGTKTVDFNACKVAKKVGSKLKNADEIQANKEIKLDLNCKEWWQF